MNGIGPRPRVPDGGAPAHCHRQRLRPDRTAAAARRRRASRFSLGNRISRTHAGRRVPFRRRLLHTALGLRYSNGPGGAGSPKSPLYGIWDVHELSIDGEVRAPMLNEYDRRWRRVVFDSPEVMVFQRTDDSFARYGVTVDVRRRTLALIKGSSRTWGAHLTDQRPADNQLIIEGRMDDHVIRVRLRRLDLDTFRLLNSRFRWVRPPDPFAG